MIPTARAFWLPSAFSSVHQGRGHVRDDQRSRLSIFGRKSLLTDLVSSALRLKGD